MIEQYNYTGEGYHPCLIRENWQGWYPQLHSRTGI